MPQRILTPQLIHAAACDAGNRHMRSEGRKQWNADDWNAMCEEFERLCPAPQQTGTGIGLNDSRKDLNDSQP